METAAPERADLLATEMSHITALGIEVESEAELPSRAWSGRAKVLAALLALPAVLALAAGARALVASSGQEAAEGVVPVESSSQPGFLSSLEEKADFNLVFDCTQGYSKWRTGWSPSKQKYCCKHTGKGCAHSHYMLPMLAFGLIGALVLIPLIGFPVWAFIRNQRSYRNRNKWQYYDDYDRRNQGGCCSQRRCCGPNDGYNGYNY